MSIHVRLADWNGMKYVNNTISQSAPDRGMLAGFILSGLSTAMNTISWRRLASKAIAAGFKTKAHDLLMTDYSQHAEKRTST